MGLICNFFGHKMKDFACTRCGAMKGGFFSEDEYLKITEILSFAAKHDKSRTDGAILALFRESNKPGTVSEGSTVFLSIICDGMILAAEKGWDENNADRQQKLNELIGKSCKVLMISSGLTKVGRQKYQKQFDFIEQQQSTPVAKVKKEKTILDQYREGLKYLNECSGSFNEAKLREFNCIIGSRFPETQIVTYLSDAKLMINGMEEVKKILKENMAEAISMFEGLEQNGIDLSMYAGKI